MQTYTKIQKYKITPEKHVLLYGSNAVGMCVNTRAAVENLKKHFPFDKRKVRTFRYPKHTRLFLAKLEKRFFKRFKRPIFSKIENKGRTIIYGVGDN